MPRRKLTPVAPPVADLPQPPAPALAWFTPWPPQQNGIADYAFRVARELARRYPSTAYSDLAGARLPAGVERRRLADLPETLPAHVCPVHQIGNNHDHGFVVEAALAHPGITVLHDLGLLYLHQGMKVDQDDFYRQLARSNPAFAALRAHEIAYDGDVRRSDHMLFRMLGRLVERSRRVVVHTHYARMVLERSLGPALATRIRVLPHFAMAAPPLSRAAARARLGLDPDTFVVLTSGFATAVKRYDWLIPALERVFSMRRRVLWVQAGPVRPDEYDLAALVARHPDLAQKTRFTGYVSEGDLDAYIQATDVLVNLRYPSVGESSGSLARALAAGAACLVSDTAGYREIPDAAVIKIPLDRAPAHLEAVIASAIRDPALLEPYRRAARAYAETDLAMERYVADFSAIVDDCLANAADEAGDGAAEEAPAAVTRRLGPFAIDDLSFGSLARRDPTLAQARHIGIVKPGKGDDWFLDAQE